MGDRYIRVLAVLTLLTAFGARGETITVAAAVSLKDALAAIAPLYKAETGEDVEFIHGSSGQMLAQIRNGAPVDAFISAAAKQVDDLSKAGLTDDTSRRVVAGNRLVLIVPAEAATVPQSIKDLTGPGYTKIAVGEPRSVPAGQYVAQVLKSMKLDAALADRLVYGSNVRQVLDYVERGEVSAGFVYATDAKQAETKVKIALTVDEAAHEQIVYPAIVIKDAKHAAAARKFLDFLGGEKARQVLQEKGFSAPPPEKAAK